MPAATAVTGTRLAHCCTDSALRRNLKGPTVSDDQHSFGVFKPVGHVVMSFPSQQQADDAAQALSRVGMAEGDVRRFSDREMVAQIDQDIASASPLASIGQEMNLVKAQRELALQGYHFIVARAGSDERAALIAREAERCGAERAQSYGRFVIEELIDRPGELAQVGESPDRGLDAQTPSGEETETAVVKQRIEDGGPVPREPSH